MPNYLPVRTLSYNHEGQEHPLLWLGQEEDSRVFGQGSVADAFAQKKRCGSNAP